MENDKNKYKKALVIGAVGFGCYLIGFYECKYRIMKELLEIQIKSLKESQK